MRKALVAAVAALVLMPSGFAIAATPKPTAKPSVKHSLLPSVSKPVVKKSTAATSTKKTSTSAKASSTTTKKRYVRRVYKRKYIKPIPPPPQVWPPTNFFGQQGVYINFKVSASALATAISQVTSDSTLYKDSQLCNVQSCGVVQLGSETGCDWWEIDSTLYGVVDSSTTQTMIRGTLQTFAPGTAAKKVITNYLVSPVPLSAGDRVVPTKALCWSKSSGASQPSKIPDNVYVAYPSK